MYTDKSVVTIKNSHFSDSNYTLIYVDSGTDLAISDSTFKNSTSPALGGFLYISSAYFTLENLVFENGKAYEGGAIYFTHDFTDSVTNHRLDLKN